MTDAIAKRETALIGGQDIATIRGNVQAVQKLKKDLMIENTHFGQIPGTNKPTLFQPGAELLLQLFGLGVGEPVIDELEHSHDRIAYRVRLPIVHLSSGNVIGYGVGECSTDEEKYRWREAVCVEEYDGMDPTLRREKWKRGKDGKAYCIQQVRTLPADLANTVLKMAEKRAKVDGAKGCTAASDMFTQDLEDIPAEVIGADAEAPKPPRAVPATGRTATDGQRKMLFAVMRTNNVPDAELKTHLKEQYGIDSTSDLNMSDVDAVKQWLEGAKPQQELI